MSASRAALAAKRVIEAAWQSGPAYDLASQAVFALEAAQLLLSPEVAAELVALRKRVVELERPAVEAERAAVVHSYRELAAQCREDRDYEAEADVLLTLREREEHWRWEDEQSDGSILVASARLRSLLAPQDGGAA